MEKFSIIIPTMQRSPLLWQMLPNYVNCQEVAEIIIINNVQQTFKLPKLQSTSKIQIINPGRNIMVNAAWNLGASIAKHTIILANDDIIIHNTELMFQLLSRSKHSMVGASVNGDPNSIIYGIETYNKELGFPRRSFGCFMMVRNYNYIPEQIRILSGDNFLFEQATTVGILTKSLISTPISVTIRSNPEFDAIGRSDVQRYRHLKANTGQLNIVIRTSGRPRYFAACIKSIKQHAPDAMLHITIDHLKDLGYVQKECVGFKYNYYLLNKSTIAGFCSKIPITRQPFVYEYYFNVVRPFLHNTVMLIDDDDMMISRPQTNLQPGTVHLYQADIAGRIVPEDFTLPVKLNKISTLCVVFNAADMIDWIPQRGGDYDFISTITKNKTVVTHGQILSGTQTGGNWGKRNDLIV